MSRTKTALSLSDACHEDGRDQQAHVAKIVDEHVEWLLVWHRLAFLSAVTAQQSLARAAELPAPKAFAIWFKGPAQRLPTEQPTIDKLAVLHDQLHKLARMLLMKAEGKPLAATDYELVMRRYLDFITALRKFERDFSAAAAGRDTLTGLRSRFALCEDIAAEQNRMARTDQPFCVALLDIDGFTILNQLHGQETGDKALQQLAVTITDTMRAYDDIYRVGADEYLICLKGTDAPTAARVLERLQQAIGEARLRLFGGGQQEISVAIGLVEAKANEEIPFLLHRAEQAVAEAKRAGGNCLKLGSDKGAELS